MKLNAVISVILLFIYSVPVFVGVGIIRCGCTDTQRLVLMSFHPSCLCSNSTNDCCRHNDQHHDEDHEPGCQDEDCCSFMYKYVNVDHLNVTQFNDHPTKVLSLLLFPHFLVNRLINSFKGYTFGIKNNSPPFCLLQIPLIYIHRQLRL